MLTSLSESVVDMLCSRPPSLQVLIAGLRRGDELHPKRKRLWRRVIDFRGGVVDAGMLRGQVTSAIRA